MYTLPLFQFSKSVSRNLDESVTSLTKVFSGVEVECLRSAITSAETCFCHVEVDLCSIAVIHYGQEVSIRFEPAPEARVIAFIKHANCSQFWGVERLFNVDSVQILSQNVALDLKLAPGNCLMVVSLPVLGELDALKQRLFWSSSFDTLLSRRIQYLLFDVVRQLHFSATYEKSIARLQVFFDELIELLQNPHRELNFDNVETFDTSSVRFKHFLNAFEYMHSNPLWSFDIVELAKVSHISKRSLFSWFKHYTGVTPYQYYSALHLSMVRSELLRRRPQEVVISEIALDHGFYHLSRFSRKYRQLFGELPSETLRKL